MVHSMVRGSRRLLIHKLSTSYQQNQNLKLGADFRILEKTPQYIPPLKNLWGIRGYTPLGFKCAYMLGKKIFGGWGVVYTKEKTVSNTTRLQQLIGLSLSTQV